MSESLLDVLRRRFPEASTTTLRQMLRNDRVTVNGAPERVARRPIGEADRVEVLPRHARALDPRLRMLHEDGDLVVVDKAAGLLSVPISDDDPRLAAAARAQQGARDSAEDLLDAWAGGTPGNRRIFHVHRLDRDASGVLVFARSEFVRDRLQALFAAHDLERVYVAIVHGTPRPRAGTLRSFLAEGGDLRVRRVADASEGKEAITHYRTVAAGARFARLAVTLETGRRHQIRVQLAGIGHPLVGDALYARGREDPLGRLALHAERLAFAHPRTRRRVAFVSPPPAAFDALAL